ncbi:ribosomal protein L7/L12 C-terminal domain-containing protein [Russula earlei]|uniref:Ribosomal protein L7/L12 C-terminal domain-containing protein n=1 Tax=Russula earlei TaxID=71964 RepID=A0ACC0UID7_9AGAM|nr:ribosomal protein L7/L12 C-terminal domain-containing protein [Russula earlei]
MMHRRCLPLAVRTAAARRQCVSARRTASTASMRVRALATATSPQSPSSSPPPPPHATPPPPPPSHSPTTTTTSAAAPGTPSDPALHRLVDDISALTLLQAADLVTLLKTRLNIQEIALPAAGASIVGAAPSAGADEGAAAGEEAAAKPKEKTIFNVKLESFDAGSKPKVIKEVKALVPNLTLIEAKKFVESLPKLLKEGIPKEDAEKIKNAFEAHGATVVLE